MILAHSPTTDTSNVVRKSKKKKKTIILAHSPTTDTSNVVRKSKKWAWVMNTKIDGWWCSLTQNHLKLAAISFLCMN